MAEARAKRLISRSAANKAGEQIRKSSPQFADDTYHDSVAQAMQWRNQHFAPTQQCFRQILDVIDDIDGAVATFRLKRLISIENKLRRANSDFKLGALDDIGGCRVILDSIDQVEQSRMHSQNVSRSKTVTKLRTTSNSHRQADTAHAIFSPRWMRLMAWIAVTVLKFRYEPASSMLGQLRLRI